MDPVSGDPTGEEVVVHDTPLLINIKGCGYPPTIVCDDYAETYSNYSLVTASYIWPINSIKESMFVLQPAY